MQTLPFNTCTAFWKALPHRQMPIYHSSSESNWGGKKKGKKKKPKCSLVSGSHFQRTPVGLAGGSMNHCQLERRDPWLGPSFNEVLLLKQVGEFSYYADTLGNQSKTGCLYWILQHDLSQGLILYSSWLLLRSKKHYHARDFLKK